jgi:hypothetical protein
VPRLFYAYAEALQAAGRTDDAIRAFLEAAGTDVEGETDAEERAIMLGAGEGVVAAEAEPEIAEAPADDGDADDSELDTDADADPAGPTA